ncbi:MAG: hypothetical protein Q4C52_13045, partial [Eubacteriales bacterium]|nr:hypothetical protein [Eubacteriales bacterium]
RRKRYKWSLQKKLAAALIELSLVTTSVLGISTITTNQPKGQITAAEFDPTPLVIEADEPGSAEPQGVYYGTVVITGPGIEGGGYEGLMFVDMDGEYIRITCTDAVRSQFGDVF